MASALAQRYPKQDSTGRAEDLSDEDLLERFLNGDAYASQEAFRSLVVRHGPMVLGTCRHVLSEHHDAEDAFQATFLVLARKGATIRNRRVLAGWLHEVAHRIAVKTRASAARRRNVERQSLAMSPPAIEPGTQDQAAAWNELRPVLHAEVERLPERYRVPVILSYLEGKTNEEVAELLRWPVGTVKGRLSRARDLLRSRLLRRGLSLSAAFIVTAWSRDIVLAEVVPAELITRTVTRGRRVGPQPVRRGADARPDSGSGDGVHVTGQVQAAVDPPRQFLFISQRGWFLLLAFLLSAMVSAWAGSAVGWYGGGLTGFRAAFSAFFWFLAAFWGFDPPCH
jgi:RNA polymerase sigma factor (sigma-70 family)